MSRNARELIIHSFNGTLHSAAEYWQAIKRTSVCLIQMDVELHLCAVMTEKNVMRFQTSYVKASTNNILSTQHETTRKE